jgi:Fic family protein
MLYNWQLADWPNFRYHITPRTEETLLAFAQETGYVSGLLQALPDNVQIDTLVNVMVAEAIKTSAIEGEYLSRPDVMSSVRNHLGLSPKKEPVADHRANGAGQLMVAVRNSYAAPISSDILFEWHNMLLGGMRGITAGVWRSHAEPMQVISGTIGKEKVHFEAPPSVQVATEMVRFIQWFNDTAPGGNAPIKNAPVRSAIAHLYFESVHPFEDGNGRMGRAIAEKTISQTLGRPVLLSLSQVIEADKNAYYNALEAAQHSNDITTWLEYFVDTCYRAQLEVKAIIGHTLQKAKFIDRYRGKLNGRQHKVVLRMLESPDGFEGGMTAGKYTSLTRASKATATRDLQELTEMGAFSVQGGGRSTHYFIRLID